MDVKPWDDETDMVQLEKNVRGIEKEGLVWGGSKLVAVGFGIKKLQINLVIEDDKVSLDELQQQVEEDEDHVQSTDIVSAIVESESKANRSGCYAKVVNGLWSFVDDGDGSTTTGKRHVLESYDNEKHGVFQNGLDPQ
jgi:translation elongation factor EF-1beta